MNSTLVHVVGARPNFMKAAPVMRSISKSSRSVTQRLIHTGQHFDTNMSQVFFEDLRIAPDVNLGVGSGNQAHQTAAVMTAFDSWIDGNPADLVVVYGDVNSTLAAALVAAKRGIRVAHVEAGLRSFDPTMPEEINRVLTDHLSDVLLTPSSDADENLLKEGTEVTKIHLVGNVMIDTLLRSKEEAESRWRSEWRPVLKNPFVLVTLHRPSHVDDPARLEETMRVLEALSRDIEVVFPMHPRTRKHLSTLGRGVRLLEPLPYLDFLGLQMHAELVITDSGGIQEETTVLGVPCLTLRSNTERPVTVEIGTNSVVGDDPSVLPELVHEILDGQGKKGSIPPLWDGRAGERIAEVLLS